MSVKLKYFLLGAFVSFLLLVAIWLLLFTHVISQLGKPHVLADDKLRSQIENHLNAKIPEKSSNLYFAQAGFVDPTQYVALSIDKKDFEAIMKEREILGKFLPFDVSLLKDSEFPKKKSFGLKWEHFFPSRYGKGYETDYWRLDKAVNGLYYSDEFEFILYDLDARRLYGITWTM